MKSLFFLIILLFLTNCSKSKTVLICGDHVCINKAEANQYFEENLSIEVKVVEKKTQNSLDLVELNLNENRGKKEISISSKENTDKDVKILSNEEIAEIKDNIKNKKKRKKVVKNLSKRDKLKKKTNNIKIKNVDNSKVFKEKKSNQQDKIVMKKTLNKKKEEIFDVCTILKECSIEEISKYLIEQGKKKNFPDLTQRQ
tara:strand:- start:844 stop:1440 length:597 start_codon:yes stop_codon:yes gene_type:complete